jgi:hypothetical protein
MFTGMYVFIAVAIIIIVAVNIMRVKMANIDKDRMNKMH